MQSLSKTDLLFVVSCLPKDIRELMAKNPGLYVGGGFIREVIAGNEVQDIDMFGPSKEAIEAAVKTLCEGREGCRRFNTDNAITVLSPPRSPVQFITKWMFSDVENLVGSFDFTVCQAAIGYGTEFYSCISENFYSDLAARRLVYTYPVREEAAGGSLLRVRKFLQRGYNIQAESLAGVCARLMKSVNANKTDMSDERSVSRVLAGLLREVDPMRIVDGVEFVDEHKTVEFTPV